MLEAHLVKPKINVGKRILAAISDDMAVLNPDYQIYVPERFVIGNFKYNRGGFAFSS